MYLTKRQQQVLRRMWAKPWSEDDGNVWVNGYWGLSIPDDERFDYHNHYGDVLASSTTMRCLFDAGLVAMGWRHDGVTLVAALTPRGRRLAELLS